jgi:hypothetical protein
VRPPRAKVAAADAHVGRLAEDRRAARQQPDLVAVRQVEEHVGSGVLLVALVDDEADALRALGQRDVPVDAVGALAR